MVEFTLWALGTTQTTTIRIMNDTGFALGVLLAGKWFIRHFTSYRSLRSGEKPAAPG
jgi:hypothetical protein